MVHSLSQWYESHARPLPWRNTHDPYRIWISEVMLQQTQVTTVIPYYHRFLTAFPDLNSLAISPIETVLSLWSGLGYYSRARNLHRGAQFLLQHWNGQFPKTREQILTVPGIGPYTAGAILSIAFDLPEAIVDGNVQRVFARVYGERREIQKHEVQKFFWEMATQWVALAESPRILNQALMELGATVCHKGKPKCEQCPLQKNCVSFQNSWQEELPRKKARTKPVSLFWIALILESKGKYFLKKQPAGEWWEGLWGFPHLSVGEEAEFELQFHRWRKQLPKQTKWRELPFQTHTVTHHKIKVAPYLIQIQNKNPMKEGGEWFSPEDLESLALSSLARKTFASVVLK